MDDKVEIQESAVTPPPHYEMKMKYYREYRLVYFILGFIEVLLALRFFLKLMAANPQNAFAALIYGITSLLLLPFSGLFARTAAAATTTVSVIEPSIVVAMIVYALLAWGIGKWIIIFKSRPRKKA